MDRPTSDQPVTETRAALEREISKRWATGAWLLLIAVAVRVLRPDDAGLAFFGAFMAVGLLLIGYEAVVWRRIVRLRHRLGLDWLGRPRA